MDVKNTVYRNRFTTINFHNYFVLSKHLKINCTWIKFGLQEWNMYKFNIFQMGDFNLIWFVHIKSNSFNDISLKNEFGWNRILVHLRFHLRFGFHILHFIYIYNTCIVFLSKTFHLHLNKFLSTVLLILQRDFFKVV